MKLQNKIAIITGASSGIGRGIATAFAREGAAVLVNYPTQEQKDAATQVCEEILAAGGRAIAFQGDVSEEEPVNRIVEACLIAYGKIDILVNNAGVASASPVELMPVTEWDRILAVHLRGTFLMTRRVLPLLYAQDYGRIINTASQLAYKGAPGFSHYTAAKGAILSFTRSVALEIGERRVTINCVAPGATQTPMLADVPSAVLEQIRRGIPVGRIANVADIVPSYVFLASDEARHYQGQCISPNGGDVFL
jgi:3-oxoacyl-[acyl-carrier protein] reductase